MTWLSWIVKNVKAPIQLNIRITCFRVNLYLLNGLRSSTFANHLPKPVMRSTYKSAVVNKKKKKL